MIKDLVICMCNYIAVIQDCELNYMYGLNDHGREITVCLDKQTFHVD